MTGFAIFNGGFDRSFARGLLFGCVLSGTLTLAMSIGSSDSSNKTPINICQNMLVLSLFLGNICGSINSALTSNDPDADNNPLPAFGA